MNSYRRFFSLVLWTLSVLFVVPTQAEQSMDRVTTLPVPDGGQAVVARLDRAGTIHLLFDTSNGPCYSASIDHGKSFSAEIPIVDAASKKPGLEFYGADLAVGKNGMIHVALSTNAWKLKLPQSEWGFYYARLEPGLQTFSPVQNLNNHPSEGFSLAADDKGNVTACWLSGKLYANVSHDSGRTFIPQTEIDPAFDPCDCCTTSSSYGSDGKLALLYREETNNERDMYLILWDQGQSHVSRTKISSTSWKIDACPMSSFTICPNRNGYLAVWPTKGQIYFARLDGEGKLSSPGEIETAGKAGMHTGMLGLSALDGSILVAWKKNDQLNWQRYDKHGKTVGTPSSVSSAGNAVAGVVDDEGQFILFR
jgi:hypothetical protein